MQFRFISHALYLKTVLICATLWIILSLFSCTKKLSPEQIKQFRLAALENAKNAAISEYVAHLSDEVKISQLFLVNVEGNEKFSAVEKTGSLYGKNGEENPLVPGGVLLFSYNISKDPLQTYEYIKSIHDFYIKNGNPPPYVCVDQEGGDVNRLRGLTSVLWSQEKVSESFSQEGAAELYASQARQMNLLGFHTNLAPVIEVENEENKDFLDTRSFGNLENVLLYGKNCILGYENNKIGTVLKHFPGNSSTDPHSGLPEIAVTKSEFENQYLAPFKNLLPYSSAVLMSHARVTISDDETYSESKTPACLSEYWVTQILKNELGFEGLVFSDDIFMGALSKNGYPPEVAVTSAIEAGVDVIMLSEKRFGAVAGILLQKAKENPDFAQKINRACENVIRYKIRAGLLTLLEEESESPAEESVPQFKVIENQEYADFDLYQFNEEYKRGMKAYEN